MEKTRFTPHFNDCMDRDCAGQCVTLVSDEHGSVVPSSGNADGNSGKQDPFPATPRGHEFIRRLEMDGVIGSISCIWEDTSPSYVIQFSEDCKLEQAVNLVHLMADLGISVRISNYMSNDCKGRRIF